MILEDPFVDLIFIDEAANDTDCVVEVTIDLLLSETYTIGTFGIAGDKVVVLSTIGCEKTVCILDDIIILIVVGTKDRQNFSN